MDDALTRLGSPPWEKIITGVSIAHLEECTPPIPDVGGRMTGNAGEFARIVNGTEIRFVAFVEFLPGQSRGNHFHDRRIEFLYVAHGAIQAEYESLDTCERVRRDHFAGDLIAIQSRTAHKYLSQSVAYAIEMAQTVYDPMETHAHLFD